MSNARIAPKLKGYEGPFYPRVLSKVQERFRPNTDNIMRLSPEVFSRTATRLHGWKRFPFKTPDGYTWMFSVTFTFQRKKIRVLAPMPFDTERQDGTVADRHIVLYVRGETTDEFAEAAAVHFVEVLEEVFYRDLYAAVPAVLLDSYC